MSKTSKPKEKPKEKPYYYEISKGTKPINRPK
jgi:hypothetical protein